MKKNPIFRLVGRLTFSATLLSNVACQESKAVVPLAPVLAPQAAPAAALLLETIGFSVILSTVTTAVTGAYYYYVKPAQNTAEDIFFNPALDKPKEQTIKANENKTPILADVIPIRLPVKPDIKTDETDKDNYPKIPTGLPDGDNNNNQDPNQDPNKFNRFFKKIGSSAAVAKAVANLVNDLRSSETYHPSERYSSTSEFYGMHPDAVRQARDPEVLKEVNRAFDELVAETKSRQLARQTAVLKLYNRVVKQSNYIDQAPLEHGYDNTAKPIIETEKLFYENAYAMGIEELYKIQNNALRLAKNNQKPELVEYWQKTLSSDFITDSGILKVLPIANNPYIKLDPYTYRGSYAARNINHISLFVEQLNAAWGYWYLKDPSYRPDESNDPNSKYAQVADLMHKTKVLAQKVVEDNLRYANGDNSVHQQALENIIREFVSTGEILQEGRTELDFTLKALLKDVSNKVIAAHRIYIKEKPKGPHSFLHETEDNYNPTFVPTSPEKYLEEYVRWRRMVETIKEFFKNTQQDSQPGFSIVSQTPTPALKPLKEIANLKETSATKENNGEAIEEEDEEAEFTKEEFDLILSDLIKYKGEIFTDEKGNRFLISEILSSLDANLEYKHLKTNAENPYKTKSILLKVTNLNPIELYRGVEAENNINIRKNTFFAFKHTVLKQDNSFVKKGDWKELLSMPQIPNFAVSFKFPANTKFVFSLTSKVFEGVGGIEQIQISEDVIPNDLMYKIYRLDE